MANPKTQAEQRRDITLQDQFERRWLASIEIATGDPTGRVSRVGGWRDPIRTPQSFLSFPKDFMRGGYRVVIDYDAWITQQTEGEENWYKELNRVARDQYKRLDPSDVPQLENDGYIRSLVGPKPWPSSSVIKAAKAGDRQYLGFEPMDAAHRKALGMETLADLQVNVADAPAVVSAKPLNAGEIPPPPDTYQDFVAYAMRYLGCKGDLTKAAALWKEHRENLKAATVG